MPFFIRVDTERKLVCVRHEGEMTSDELFGGRAESARRLQQHGFNRLLVDVRDIDSPPSTLDTFESSASHDKVFPPGFRLAILTHPRFESDARFSATVAVNRGFDVQTFTRENEALEWLIEGIQSV